MNRDLAPIPPLTDRSAPPAAPAPGPRLPREETSPQSGRRSPPARPPPGVVGGAPGLRLEGTGVCQEVGGARSGMGPRVLGHDNDVVREAR